MPIGSTKLGCFNALRGCSCCGHFPRLRHRVTWLSGFQFEIKVIARLP
jgi:hypothetical protein